MIPQTEESSGEFLSVWEMACRREFVRPSGDRWDTGGYSSLVTNGTARILVVPRRAS